MEKLSSWSSLHNLASTQLICVQTYLLTKSPHSNINKADWQVVQFCERFNLQLKSMHLEPLTLSVRSWRQLSKVNFVTCEWPDELLIVHIRYNDRRKRKSCGTFHCIVKDAAYILRNSLEILEEGDTSPTLQLSTFI